MCHHPRAWSNLIRRLDMDIVAHKRCSKCGEAKPLDEFPKDKACKDGTRADCKSCKAAQNKAYRAGRVEEYKKTKHAYYIAHRDHCLEKAKEWHLNNLERSKLNKYLYVARNRNKQRESVKKASEKWRKNHPEYKRGWIEDNPNKGREYNWTRRTRRKNCGGHFTAKQWEVLLEKYGNKCLCCGRSDVKITADHVVPLRLGGSNTIGNIQPLCKSCNCKKALKIIDYRPS
jgi:hypothetical protein